MESFIASIEEKISDVRGGKSSMGQALTFALNMEESILEGRFFETVRSDDESFRRLVELLADDLARHRQQIIDEQGKIS